MTASLLSLTFAAALFCWAGGPYPESHPVTALERAVQQEEIEHDWESAAVLYLGLMQREVPAWIRMEAEIRYARCQLKLGKPADAEKSLLDLAGRLRKERMPDANEPGAAPAQTQARLLETAMKEIAAASASGSDRTRLMEAALDGMARTLSPNGGYVPPQDIETLTGDFAGIGAVLAGGDRITIRETVPGSPLEKAGVPGGTEILEIDGKTPFAQGGSLSSVVAAIRGPAGTSVNLRVKYPDGDLKDLTLQRTPLNLATASCSPILTSEKGGWEWVDETTGIAGVKIHQMSPDTPQQLREILTGEAFAGGRVKGLILDLWENGGGGLNSGKQVADFFLKEGVILGIKEKDEVRLTRADAAELLPGVPIAVLVSRRTASSAELVASALQDNRRAAIIGERSFGRGEIMKLKGLPGGGAIKVPGGNMLRASGQGLERREGMTDADAWGVIPDISVTAPPQEPGTPPEETKTLYSEALHAAFDYLKTPHAK